MSYRVPAPPGTFILVLDRDDRTAIRIPVVAFDATSTIAYPIAPMAFGGLLKAKRALEIGDYIVDRGFEIPFDSEEAWIQWAMSVEPEAEAEGDPDELQAKREATINASVHDLDKSMGNDGQRGNETPHQMRDRLLRENANKPFENVTDKPRKTFASKSFWSRQNTDGSMDIIEVESGDGLPRDQEGFEKIKRDDFAALKKRGKAGEPITVMEWSNGPVENEPGEEQADDEDFGGLV